MQINEASGRTDIRYEPDERPSYALSIGLGLQASLLVLPAIVLLPTIIIRATNQGEDYLSWAIFAALLVCGAITALQALRFGRIGAGHVLIMGVSAPLIAVCILALVEGGIALMASLIIVSSLFQFALSTQLSLLRRIITPVVSGTVMMLIAATVVPIAFDMLTDVPEGASSAAAPSVAAVTVVAFVALTFHAKGVLRLWAPVIGVVAGCVAAAFFGLYDTTQILAAPWVSIPAGGWPGFTLTLDTHFWALLPAFVFITLAATMGTIGTAIAIQQVSRRMPQAIDFRAVQGGVAANGLGNLLSGLAGTAPVMIYPISVPLTELTGVAARRVGVCIGVILLSLAFMSKITAFLLAVPKSVIAAYLVMVMALIFVQGMKVVVQDGIDYRKAAVVGLAFWIGTGFQNQAIFADQLGETWGRLLGNGVTAGGLVAIALTVLMELTGPRRRRIETALDIKVLPRLNAFLREQAERLNWDAAATERLFLIGEETLSSLAERHEGASADELRRLLVMASDDGAIMELEFVAAIGEGNLEDQMRLLGDQAEAQDGHEISLRLLRHFASSVRHQQYHDMDVVTVRIKEGDD